MKTIMVYAQYGNVVVQTAHGTGYVLNPRLALELAQSLVRKAKEADACLDVSTMSDVIDLTKEVH